MKEKVKFVPRFTAVCMSVIVGASAFGFGLATQQSMTPPVAVVSEANSVDFEDFEIVQQVNSFEQVASTTTTGSTVSDVVKLVTNSVVSINTKGVAATGYFGRESAFASAGSGVIFQEDNEKVYIVTNYHVIESANEVSISLDDKTYAAAHFVGGDSLTDIAVIYVEKTELKNVGINSYKVIKFGDSSSVQIGDFVLAIGNALGEGKSATFGIISTDLKTVVVNGTSMQVFQTDAAINRGNSGGALVNTKGELVGINSVKAEAVGVEGMGYAIPSNNVKSLINQIMSTGQVERPYIGLAEYIEVTEQIREYYAMPSVGIYVQSIMAGSPAVSAGLKKGDIITSFNGVAITNIDSLQRAIDQTKSGQQVAITVKRSASAGRGQGTVWSDVTLSLTVANYTTGQNF